MNDMKKGTLLKTGLAGTLITALCCFTPVLGILLSALGFSFLIGMLDYVLLPALAFFMVMTVYSLMLRRKA